MKLRPQAQTSPPLSVDCTFQLDQPVLELPILLHPQLRVSGASANARIEQDDAHGSQPEGGLARRSVLRFPNATREVSFHYEGNISEPIEQGVSPGVISEEGVSLMPESYWYPVLVPSADSPLEYQVSLDLPESWHGIIPGAPTSTEYSGFRGVALGLDLALVAARFGISEVSMPHGPRVSVWLRASQDTPENEALARTFLELVPSYIERYSSLIGEFPYPAYAVVENFLETGFAFPGFTLLGSSVMRLPFILRSSLPHEVLHSWWGNAVGVDYSRGNWSEGLTTYLADRAFQIEEGQGSTYRRKALQAYQDFVTRDRDFPVRQFVARHDQGSQAVGYGKVMMIFEMLENYLGSELFHRALSAFYRSFRGQLAGFDDLQVSFEKEAGRSLQSFFGPWLDQTGAPRIAIESAKVQEGWLELQLSQQLEPGLPYVLPLRGRLSYADGRSQELALDLGSSRPFFRLKLEGNLRRLELDPDFRVFRKLDEEEMPFTFSKVFAFDSEGSAGPRSEVILSVPALERDAFEPWVSAIRAAIGAGDHAPPIRVITDEVSLPKRGAIWILGTRNRHAEGMIPSLRRHEVAFGSAQVEYAGRSWSATDSAVFFAERLGKLPAIWVWSEAGAPAQTLIPKILHYSGFSIAGFVNGKNTLRAEWPIVGSSLAVDF